MSSRASRRARADREAADAEWDWQWQLITYAVVIGLGWVKILWHIARGEAIYVTSDIKVSAVGGVGMSVLLTILGGALLWRDRRRRRPGRDTSSHG